MSKFLLFAFSIIAFTNSIAAVNLQSVQVVFNDEYKSKITLQQINSVNYISLKDIANLTAGKLSWYRISGKVIFSINTHQICFYYNSKNAVIDTKKIKLHSATFVTSKDIYIPLEFFISDNFSKVSDYKIQFDTAQNILFVEKVVNVFSPRIYTEKSLVKVSIELLEKLTYDFKQKSNKEYIITFYKAKAIEEKINFENAFVERIEMRSKAEKVTCKLKLRLPDLNLRCYYKYQPIRLIVEISSPKELAKLFISTPVISSTALSEQTISQPTVPVIAPVISSTAVSSLKTLPVTLRPLRIVLDPGHGGEDPGAIGPNGTKEKEINLSIAKELARLLKEDDYEVFITRENDTFIPLVDRTQFANDKKADIFISIHCNASIKKDTSGFEIYFLSETASDPEAAAVAARENAVVKLEGKLTEKKERLQQLLWAMVVNEFMNEAAEFCSFVAQEVTKRLKIDNRGIKQAGFYVLRGAQMPAVVVECDFISHRTAELKLRSKKVQKYFADSMYQAIKQYVDRKGLLANKKL